MHQEFVHVSSDPADSIELPLRSKRKKSLGAGDSALNAYMRSMNDYPTFSAEEEREVATALRQARCDRWGALLCYPPLIASTRALIEERLEVSESLRAELARLEDSGERFRLRRSLANQAEFEGLCKAI